MSDLTPTFVQDRQLFFSQSPHERKAAHTKSLAFLTQNYVDIKATEATLKAALDALNIETNNQILDDEEKEQYRLFYLYCCDLLKAYHQKRGEPQKPDDNWINYLHDNLGYWHCLRILLAFSRLTDELLVRMMNDAGWFESLNRSIAPIFDFDQSINILSLPVETFYILSFSLLGIRFIVECARIFKHTFDSTDEELKALSAWDRFCHETYKHRFSLANDLVWITCNALNNNPLTLLCVFFDLSLLLYRKYETEQTYSKTKEAYEQRASLDKKTGVAKQELRELELTQVEVDASLNLSLSAASSLLTGFSLLLVAPVPIVAPIGSLLCVLGTALYLSADAYGNYQKKTYYVKQLEADSKSLTEINKAKEAQQLAWDEGWSTFTKNTCLPVLFIGVLAVCWPAALLLMTAYCAYEMSPKEDTKTHQLSPA